MRGQLAARHVVCASLAFAVTSIAARGSAAADTKVFQAAQVQFDVRDEWTVADAKGGGMVMSDPSTNLILVAEVLEASALEQALKDADGIIKKNIERVRWQKKPMSRELNGMKAWTFDGTGRIKNQALDVGAIIVITPANKLLLVYGFMAKAQAGALQPQIDALVGSIRPARAETARRPPPQPDAEPEPARGAPPAREAPGQPAAPTGFVTVYLPPSARRFQRMLAISRKADLDKFVDVLNQLVAMPRLIPIQLRECGRIDAGYSPADHAIQVCYEIIEYFLSTMPTAKTAAEADTQAAGVLKFTLMHEMAHALSSELELPITGKEEDAADEFAAILLPLEGDTGFQAAQAAAAWFAAEGSQKAKAGHIAWYDEHSFDLQRMYDIVCMLYGADQPRYQRLTAGLGLPEERLARCVRDYQRKVKAWNVLLGQHKRT